MPQEASGLRASFAQGADHLLDHLDVLPAAHRADHLGAGVGDRAIALDRPVPPVGHGHLPVAQVPPDVPGRCAEVCRDGACRPLAAETGGLDLNCRKSGFSRGFLPFARRLLPPAAAARFSAATHSSLWRGRNSNPMKSTMFSGQNSSHSTKKGGRKTRFLISKNGVFARRPACGGFTFGENPTHPEAFHAAFGAPRRPPGPPRARRKAPPAPRSPGAPPAERPRPTPPRRIWAPFWRHVRAAGPRGPVFAWRPPRPPRGPVCARKKPFAARRPPAPPRRRGTPARLCPRGPVFTRRPPPPGAARRAPGPAVPARRPASPRARPPRPPPRPAPAAAQPAVRPQGAFESLGAVPKRPRPPLA